MKNYESNESEFQLPFQRITGPKRVLLATLLAFAPFIPSSIFVRSAESAPMVDGPQVCSVDGSIIPSRLNPNPLFECPDNGELVRLSAGQSTLDYIKDNYPNGTHSGAVIKAAATQDPNSIK